MPAAISNVFEYSRVCASELLPGLPEGKTRKNVDAILAAADDVGAIEAALRGMQGVPNDAFCADGAVTLVQRLRQVSTDDVPGILVGAIAMYAPIFLGSKWTDLSPARRAAITALLAPMRSTFQVLRDAIAKLSEIEMHRIITLAEVTNINIMHDEGKENGANQLVLLVYFKGWLRMLHSVGWLCAVVLLLLTS